MPWWLVVLAVLVLLVAGLGALVLLGWQVWRKLTLLGREVRAVEQHLEQLGAELERRSVSAQAAGPGTPGERRPG